ncbi:MAG: hypothetical protein ACRDJU_06165 [Actinomycetota bacterium]
MSSQRGDAGAQLAAALDRAEAAVAAGKPLTGTGFWKAVGIARRRPALAARFADRIAAVDRAAFEANIKARVPVPVGNVILGTGVAAGLAALAASPRLGRFGRPLTFLAGFGALEVSTHSLAHWAVGRAVGIRFTHYFLGGPPPPRPGLKVDYASYLRVPPERRAAMHAAGAIVTKLVPFVLIPVATSGDQPRWVVRLLVLVGLGQLATDVLVSTKSSDWKKVLRELRAARG